MKLLKNKWLLLLLIILMILPGCASKDEEIIKESQEIENSQALEAQKREEKEIEEKKEKERLEAQEKKRIEILEAEEKLREEEKAEQERILQEELKKEESAKNFTKARVTKHVDGDTVHVSLESGEILKIRMIGVDTPETVHPSKAVEFYGKEASDFTKASIYDKTIYLEKDVSDTDRFGRALRYIWLEIPDGIDKDQIETKMFNAILVSSGYANSATYPPDVKYQDYFTDLERQARESSIGLWDESKAQSFQGSSSNTSQDNSSPEKVEGNYIGNINSMKFHKASCRWASETSPRNRVPFSSREESINNGYVPCKVCYP